MFNHRLFGMFGISSIVFLLLLSNVVRADYEAVGHGVKYYGGSGECSGDNTYGNYILDSRATP